MMEPREAATVVQPEMTFIVNYHCPRCHATLEARASESYSWLRCPRCGRASLPPEHMRLPPPPPAPGDDVLVIGPSSEYPGVSTAARPYSGSARRIAMAVGMLASLTMLMISFVDGNSINVAIFGGTTLVLFTILGYSARRR